MSSVSLRHHHAQEILKGPSSGELLVTENHLNEPLTLRNRISNDNDINGNQVDTNQNNYETNGFVPDHDFGLLRHSSRAALPQESDNDQSILPSASRNRISIDNDIKDEVKTNQNNQEVNRNFQMEIFELLLNSTLSTIQQQNGLKHLFQSLEPSTLHNRISIDDEITDKHVNTNQNNHENNKGQVDFSDLPRKSIEQPILKRRMAISNKIKGEKVISSQNNQEFNGNLPCDSVEASTVKQLSRRMAIDNDISGQVVDSKVHNNEYNNVAALKCLY